MSLVAGNRGRTCPSLLRLPGLLTPSRFGWRLKRDFRSVRCVWSQRPQTLWSNSLLTLSVIAFQYRLGLHGLAFRTVMASLGAISIISPRGNIIIGV